MRESTEVQRFSSRGEKNIHIQVKVPITVEKKPLVNVLFPLIYSSKSKSRKKVQVLKCSEVKSMIFFFLSFIDAISRGNIRNDLGRFLGYSE